jgi:acylphosphatase
MELDLAGWVLNRRDGGVEVAAEGDPTSLEHMRKRLAEGPAGARVERIEEVPNTTEPLTRPFAIRRSAPGSS